LKGEKLTLHEQWSSGLTPESTGLFIQFIWEYLFGKSGYRGSSGGFMRTSLFTIGGFIMLGACRSGQPCEISTDCHSTEVCADAVCEYAFNRFYDVVIIEAVVPEDNAESQSWDADANGPDVYAETGFSGESNGCFTHVVFDTTTPFWEAVCPVWIPDYGTFLINLWDEDIGSDEDDWIAGFYWEGAESFVEVLRSDGVAIETEDEYDSASIRFTVLP
jgi:hypothetical protein